MDADRVKIPELWVFSQDMQRTWVAYGLCQGLILQANMNQINPYIWMLCIVHSPIRSINGLFSTEQMLDSNHRFQQQFISDQLGAKILIPKPFQPIKIQSRSHWEVKLLKKIMLLHVVNWRISSEVT